MADPRPPDLTDCDREPLHLIGAIQPCGALVAASQSDGLISHVSANCQEILGHQSDALIGTPLSGLLGETVVATLEQRPLAPTRPDLYKPWPVWIADRRGAMRRFECLAHTHNGTSVLEFLPAEEPPEPVERLDGLRLRIISELTRPRNVGEFCDLSADLLRMLTGYDRVMIYRFHEDGHGEVIAESTDRPDRLLGLHYPASDIPAPARRHFLLNLVRLITDVEDRQVPIVADEAASEPIDLTYSKLRAVSPIHLEYLRNMGVRATLSTSLIIGGSLWGLIACHHYQPRTLSVTRLHMCELLGGILATYIQGLENSEILGKRMAAERLAMELDQGVEDGRLFATVIEDHADALMRIAGCDGLVLNCDGEVVTVGVAPAEIPDVRTLLPDLEDGLLTTDHLHRQAAMSADQEARCAGAALMALSNDTQDYLLLIRPSFAETVNWAGDPRKSIVVQPDGAGRLRPRQSFALWKEEVADRALPFDAGTRECLKLLHRTLFALKSRERERLAVEARARAVANEAALRVQLMEATRRRSLGELASALAHELNQPLAAIMNYVNAAQQEMKTAGGAIPEEAATLMSEAVDEASRAGQLIQSLRRFVGSGDLAPSEVDINEVVARAARLAITANPKSPVTLIEDFAPEPPRIWVDQTQIGQVVFNLVRNSCEAMEAVADRELTITSRASARAVEVSVADTGTGIPGELKPNLFKPFHSSKRAGMGIGLSLCQTVIEAHGGEIWAEDVPRGAEFCFRLPIALANGATDDG